LMAPVEAQDPRRRLLHTLDVLFLDNVKGRRLDADGTWRVPQRHAADAPLVAQAALYDHARRAWERRQTAAPTVLEPIERGPAHPR
jgi:polyphosphate kinase